MICLSLFLSIFHPSFILSPLLPRIVSCPKMDTLGKAILHDSIITSLNSQTGTTFMASNGPSNRIGKKTVGVGVSAARMQLTMQDRADIASLKVRQNGPFRLCIYAL